MAETPPRRRRGDELVEAIRLAVRAELDEHGHAGVTFEGIARRAGTSKPVLYRRFGTRAELVVDALTGRAALQVRAPLTGSLRGDLVALIAQLRGQIGADGVKTFLGLAAEVDEATVVRLATTMFEVVERRLVEIVAAARERGEIGGGEVSARVLASVISLIRGELLFATVVRRPDDFDALVDEVVVPLLRTSAERAISP